MKQLATALTAGTFTAIFAASVNAIAGWTFDPLTGGMLHEHAWERCETCDNGDEVCHALDCPTFPYPHREAT